MQRSTFSAQVYCRPSKANKKGLSPLEMSIIVNGRRVFLQLPYKAKASEFNKRHRPKELQEYVNLMQTRVNEILLDMARNGEAVTAPALKEYLKNGGYKSYTINDLFNDYLHILHQREGIDLTHCVYRKYEIVRDLFLSEVNGDADVTTITPHTVQTFYRKLQKTYKQSTVAGMMTKLHSFIQYGIDNGKFKVNPYQGIRVHRPQAEIDFLTDAELKALTDCDLANDSLSNVRDAFLLQCYSGLSFVDLEHLKPEDIQESNGVFYVAKNRIKTGVPYTAIILPQGVEILKRRNFRLHIVSNQKMNLYLKQVSHFAGLEHRLITHLGRKSYAQKLLSAGVRVETVAKALGHSSSRTTERFYCQIRKNDIIKEVGEVCGRI